MRALVRQQLERIQPLDAAEAAQLADALAWVDSGAPLWRTAKPATPRQHVVAYFPVVDGEHLLLVDHRNAQRWLPNGGHVDPGEDPRTTVVRELHEELGLQARVDEFDAPLMVTLTETVGLTSGHVDVSLWYPVIRSRQLPLRIDTQEFAQARWFHHDELPWQRTDPHLAHFLAKLRSGAVEAKR